MFLRRAGLLQEKAGQLLAGVLIRQSVLENLACGDHLIRGTSPGTYRNPPGFYIHLIEENVAVTEEFCTKLVSQKSTISDAALLITATAALSQSRAPHTHEFSCCYVTGMEVVADEDARRCSGVLTSCGDGRCKAKSEGELKNKICFAPCFIGKRVCC